MKRITAPIWMTLLALLLTACSETDEAELALLPAPLPKFTKTLDLEKKWSISTSASVTGVYSSLRPAVAYGNVFVAGSNGNVEARNLETGKLVWKVNVNAVIESGVSVSRQKVVVGSQEGEVIALDAETGKELWRNLVSSEIITPAALAEGHVVVRTVDGKLFSLNDETGKREWFFDRNVPILTLRGNSAPIIVHGAVVSGFDNGKVALFFLENGKPIWEKRIAQSAGRSELERIVDMDASPLVVGEEVYVVTYNGNLAALNLRSGEILWQREMSSFQNLSSNGNKLFVTNAEDHIRALSLNGGATLWAQTALKNRGVSAPVAAGNYVVVADFEGYLHWLSDENGEFVARQQVDSDGLAGSPIVSGNYLIAQGRNGRLVSIKFPDRSYR